MIDSDLSEPKAAIAELRGEGIAIPALGFYRNMLDMDEEVKRQDWRCLSNVIRLAKETSIPVIGVFAGREPELSLEDNLAKFADTWASSIQMAEDAGVTLAFENCTMYRDYPIRGINMTYCPAAYDFIFKEFPTSAVAMEYDPSHCLKQHIDPLRFLDQYIDRVAHVHLKDHQRDPELEHRYGCFDTRVSTDRFPGFGQIDFPGIFRRLKDVGYQGGMTIEAERDPLAHDEESTRTLLRQSIDYLNKISV